MSDIVESMLSRRQFLSTGLAVASGIATLGPRPSLADDRPDITRWALLSDPHIAIDPDDRYRGFRPYRNLQEVSAQIADSPSEGIVITGDLARLTGRAGAYENVKGLLNPLAEKRPIYLAIGNHDHRRNFQRAFDNGVSSRHRVDGRHILVANAGPVRMIVLDSLLFVNWFPGMLGGTQLAWLQTYLRVCDDTPTILFVHHAVSGSRDLWDAGRLLDLVKPVAKVKAVISGHCHVCTFSQFAGIHLINLPAIGYNFQDNQPVGWVEAQLTRQSGEFTVHAIGGDREIDGHIQRLRWRT
jgi:Icc protein